MIAGLAAEGETELSQAHIIDRGYEQFDDKLRTLAPMSGESTSMRRTFPTSPCWARRAWRFRPLCLLDQVGLAQGPDVDVGAQRRRDVDVAHLHFIFLSVDGERAFEHLVHGRRVDAV